MVPLYSGLDNTTSPSSTAYYGGNLLPSLAVYPADNRHERRKLDAVSRRVRRPGRRRW